MNSCNLVSTSTFIDKELEAKARNNCEKIGIKDISFNRIRHKFLNKWAGKPETRLEQLTNAFESDKDLIWNCLGESGSIQFISNINYKQLKNKVLIGSSDFTLIINKAYEETKSTHIYGPNASTRLDEKSALLLQSIIRKETIKAKFKGINTSSKNIKGVIKGGNLISITWGIGTNHELNLKKCILILDKLGKNNYSTYNNFKQLQNTHSFRPKAIIITKIRTKKRKELFEMLKELFPEIPILFDIQFNNESIKKKSFPIGGMCNINFSKKEVTFSQPK